MKRLLPFLFVLVSLAAFAQPNGNFQSIRLTAGKDTATFSPQPNGTILYGNGGALWFKTATYWQQLVTSNSFDSLHTRTATIDTLVSMVIRTDTLYAIQATTQHLVSDTVQSTIITGTDLAINSVQVNFALTSPSIIATYLESDTLVVTNSATVANLDVTGPFKLTGIISPAQITADQNNYEPTGFADASVIRLSVDGTPRSITGMGAGRPGEIKTLINTAGATLTIVNDSASSDAENRYLYPTALSPLLLTLDAVIQFWYDATSLRWRPIIQP